jgi:hypothetical protein
VIDDGLAIDGVAQRVADAPILQRVVAHVDADVGVVASRRFPRRQAPVGGELRDDVGDQVVHDEIDCAFAQLETAHDVVGNHLDDDAVILRAAAEIVGERLQLQLIVHRESHEPVRPGADRAIAKLGARALRHDGHDEVDREGAERLFQ